MEECRSESSYFCVDPGVELGRAMEAAAQESWSERPEGEMVGRLLDAESSEDERGEKPNEDGDVPDESAALERDERLSVTGPGYTPTPWVSVSRRGREGFASGSADGSEPGNW